MITVYGLCDRETGDLRYVGQTARSLKRRVIEHMNEVGQRRHGMAVTHWLAKHGKPEVVTLATVDTREMADQLERGWIRHMPNLLNIQTGGHLGAGWKHTPEAIAKISARHRGVPKSAEHRARLAEATKRQWQEGRVAQGYTHSPETRALLRQQALNRAARPKDERGRWL